MGKFDGYLILSDVDGTLYRNREEGIPPRNLDALHYFQQNGGKFTLSTGRSVPNIRFLTDRIHLNAPAILANGTLLYDFEAEKIVGGSHLPACTYDMVLQVLKEFPSAGVKVISGEQVWYYRVNDHCQWVEDHFGIPGPERPLAPYGDVVNKLIFVDTADEIKRMQHWCGERFSDNAHVDFVASSIYLYEMLPKNCNKGTGVASLMQYMQVDPQKICAIGDYDNDIEMLTAVPHAFCPSGAPDRIKQLCEAVFCSCKEGALGDLVAYIEQKLLG